MKNRFGVIAWVLVLICVGLGISLIVIKQQAVSQQNDLSARNSVLSNDLVQANQQLEDQKKVNATLEKDRAKTEKDYQDSTNSFAGLMVKFTEATNNLAQTQVALKTSQDETAKRDARIADLETQNQALDKQAADLSLSITNLTRQIEETKRKLATSEGEKGFLETELHRLMAEKAELERQFNDLAVLRAQVHKLKEELSVARRLQWIRQGLFASSDEKGAQKLIAVSTTYQVKPPKPNYDLNVEVNADGSVKVIPPLTNRPAATNPPAK